MDVVIIGGGAIGLASAYNLAKAGAGVTLVERDKLGHGCSYANAGLIVTSYSVPLANPQSLFNGLRWMFRHSGPFTISARLNPRLASWLIRFALACNPRTVERSSHVMRAITSAGHASFMALVDSGAQIDFGRQGWLYLYHSEAELAAARKHARKLKELGISVQHLSPLEARELEPRLSDRIVGANYFPDDAHLSPAHLIEFLSHRIRQLGVRVIEGEAVVGWKTDGGQVQALRSTQASYTADAFVAAAGAWTPTLVRELLGDLPIQPARGHSLTYSAQPMSPSLPLMLGEAHVIARPMERGMRLTGGLELAGFDRDRNPSLLARIRASASEYLDFAPSGKAQEWFGYRPLTPDSLPIIGPSRRYPNLVIAAGHGTLGMTLSLITGELVSQSLTDEPPSLDPAPFSPARFGM